MLLLRTPERKRAAAHPVHSRLFAAAPGCGDGGSKSLRNPPVCRASPTALQSFCSTLGEPEVDLLTHPALRWVLVAALEQRATVGVRKPHHRPVSDGLCLGGRSDPKARGGL